MSEFSGGTADESWNIALARYLRAAKELSLCGLEKVAYIHHIFRGNAEQQFYDELEGIRNWSELVLTLNERYNGPARRQSIADELLNLTSDEYLDSDSHCGEALQKLACRIQKLVPQAPHGRNTDVEKRDALYYAVRARTWAEAPIFVISQGMRTYKQFLDELASADQNYRIACSIRGKSPSRNKPDALAEWEKGPR